MKRRPPVTSAVFGAVLAVFLGWNAVLAGFAGGFLAGYLASDGRRTGAWTGLLAGTIAFVPVLIVVVVGVAFDISSVVIVLMILVTSLYLPGVALNTLGFFPFGIAAALVVATVMVLTIAALGGFLGGYASERATNSEATNAEEVV
ncbi:DUF5518 domain-containing protein [Haloferax sp. DFSO52]|uniref:DUF5518 domain-containing protein n=1 Tax=Haloferax sp. DFSO52 TaxID=3388505 RepID=UPI003A8A2396